METTRTYTIYVSLAEVIEALKGRYDAVDILALPEGGKGVTMEATPGVLTFKRTVRGSHD